MDQAAAQGVEHACSFFTMTPREISCCLSAAQARFAREERSLLLLSRLMALAVHAPDKLPAMPGPSLAPMTDEAIKERLLSWRRKDA